MNFREMNLKHSYISKGDNNIADAFLNQVLLNTKEYKRSVGFFSSGVFSAIMSGITSLARNNGTIKLIASPRLSEKDAYAISLGYEQRKEYMINVFNEDFEREIEALNDQKLSLLCNLIRRNILDIKIAVTDECGIYHDKLGILQDFDNNKLVFLGSSNSSYSGYLGNYERVRIFKGWEDGSREIVEEEIQEFDSLWYNTNEFVEVYEYQKVAEKKLIEIIEKREKNKQKEEIVLRDYQKKAIQAWKNNGYRGFYVMATGTGKTWTAIFSAKELLKTHQALILICAPYKHLVKQWWEDVVKVFPKADIIMVSSENLKWYQQVTDAIIKLNYDSTSQVIIISTIASFKNKLINRLIKYSGERLLIVDEAHRFTNRPEALKKVFLYMLGLSATPFSGTSAAKGRELMKYFGGQVFDLPIEVALEKGYLVPYYYYPIYVSSNEEEEQEFKHQSRIMASCFKNGKLVDKDTFIKAHKNRLRIISMLEEKQDNLSSIINRIDEQDHFVVYCGDGKLYDNNTGEEIRHIQSVKKVLSEFNYKVSQFTATENMQERMLLVDSFNKGEISVLAAIRCLDEGINIPSIKSALILSSNDDYREFVQRRGRILRTYKDKEYAKIYDIVALPSNNMEQWAKIELRRFNEYAKLAKNWNELKHELDELLIRYGISHEDINVYDYEEMEDYESE
ncbi:DEAD/DEAH box helicase family protein [uncultured Faecalicoccus sp.]|uniref:DEAD/DEAH box helicase family protein n=1 Tax=uncultured Faecalicoccus sp. TaxID=1971760 RepID=UPI00258BCF71|nr:DEAD/DEAH box helicase family protein [uncultured Faecalicoccus sp.]